MYTTHTLCLVSTRLINFKSLERLLTLVNGKFADGRAHELLLAARNPGQPDVAECWSRVPPEVKEKVLSQLTSKQLAKVARTSQEFCACRAHNAPQSGQADSNSRYVLSLSGRFLFLLIGRHGTYPY